MAAEVISLESFARIGKPLQIDISAFHVKKTVINFIKGPLLPVSELVRQALPDVSTDNSLLVRFIQLLNQKMKNYQIKGNLPDSIATSMISFTSFKCNESSIVILLNYSEGLAVPNPSVLRTSGFGSHVYGEVLVNQLLLILKEVKFKPNDVFLDIGSGYGHVVCFVAAMTKIKKVIGVEIAKNFHDIGLAHMHHFKEALSYFGMTHRPMELLNDDILQRKNLIKRATIIFCNNVAFSETLNQEIIKVLMKCKNGTRIISSKPFCKPSEYRSALCWYRRDTLAHMSDSKLLNTCKENVSWTCTEWSFTLTTINRFKRRRSRR